MPTPFSDPFWQSQTHGSGAYAPWLRDAGSLTQRIRERCTTFGIRNVRDGLTPSAQEEAALLNLPAQHELYARDVFLLADERPVVFAHSIVAAQHLHHPWQAILGLGSSSLGTLLFQHPDVQRAPLHWRALDSEHPLYRHAAEVLAAPPKILWARRSLFALHDAPLLVTEVFLPAILELPQ
jgi:chorismate--pyruvate lyase